MPLRHFVAIHNPVSGRRSAIPKLHQIAEALRRRGGRLEVMETTCAGHAVEIAAGLAPDVQAVLVAGGDGTACEVVNGLAGRDMPLLLLAKGTENLLARHLAMPSDPTLVAETLLYGVVCNRDAGMINGRLFLAVAGIGFDAECVHRLYAVRRCNITHMDYFWPVWRTFWEHRFPFLHVEIDGQAAFDGRGFLIMGMIDRYSIGVRVLPKAVPDDGLMDVAIFPCMSRWQLLRHATTVARARHLGKGGVVYRQCRAVTVRSPHAALFEVDGEPGGTLPAACHVLVGRVSFLRPTHSGRPDPGTAKGSFRNA
jgi:diacylglycerol kinase (ATP)